MASIQSLGLGSGVLTTDLVEQIVKAERESSDLRLNRREELVDAKITAYGEIKSLMSTLQGSVLALSSPSLVGQTKATSSDESLVTATSTPSSQPGTYNIEVINTAKSHALATQTFTGFDEVVGTGQLTFSFGTNSYDAGGNMTGQQVNTSRGSQTITIDESNRTLSGIRDAINNADMGVRATIINDGSGYRLLMNSSETGVDNAMRITATDGNGNPLAGGLGALAFNETQNGTGNMQQTSRGEDAQLTINGLLITRGSNQVNEVIDGVTLNLQGADVGRQVSITVAADTDQLAENLMDFVDAYNNLKKFTDDLSGYNADKQQAGLLLGDSTMRNIQSQMRALISSPIQGLVGTSYTSFTELGINTDRNNDFLLEFNQATFLKAMREERSTVVSILAKSGTTTDGQIQYVNDSINTKPGTYDVNITQLATQAKFEGGALALLDFANPVMIDNSNDQFSINVNGINANIQLNRGSYASGEDLARELALQINSNDALKRAAASVSVEYSAANKNVAITSNLYGSKSQVYITAAGSNTANTLGFNVLGGGTYEGVGLNTLGPEAFNGKGATTQIGSRSVDASTGLNFAANNATFSLSVDGNAAVPVTVNLNASGQDLNGDGVFGDRNDSLQAIQTAIDSTSLNGQVVAKFDRNGFLQFETVAEGVARSIDITAVGSNTNDDLLGLSATQGVQTNGKDPGLLLSAPVEFNVQVDGTESTAKVAVPAGNYATGQALAAAVQTALQAQLDSDPAFAGKVVGANTAGGTRDMTGVDFSGANAGFRLNVSGVERDILVTGNDPDPIVNVQAALDTAYGAGVVNAALDGNGLQLTTVATGYQSFIEVMNDGRGARSSSFADVSTGIDFSQAGQNAQFTLAVDGVDINVNVTGNGSAGSNNSASNVIVIQQAIDSALQASGQFAAGDVLAKVNDSGQLFFETNRKNGVKTSGTFGSNASIEVKNLAGTAVSNLGLVAETSGDGYDGFGLNNQRTFGYSLDAQVDYNLDADSGLGSLAITIGGQGTRVGFTELDPAAMSFLGLQDAMAYSPSIPKGKDVAGTINGVAATGNGQFLRAADGNVKATPGFYLGNTAADFSSAVELNATNNSFRINIDGVEADVTLNEPATFVSGSALALALQAAINNTAEFKDQNIGVKVEYTDDPTAFSNGKFGIISNATGAKSGVQIAQVSNDAAAVFGFSVGIGDGAQGKAEQGSASAASGIRLKVNGGSIGDRGSVTFISGFADQLKNLLSTVLTGQNSVLGVRQSGLETDKETINQDRERLNTRLAATEARLRSQFLVNDLIVSKLNSTLDYVKSQFEAMTNSRKK